MTDPAGPRPAQPVAADRVPSARADALPDDAVGCWVVRTLRSTHLFDLDAAAYARVPGPESRAFNHDRTWLRLLRLEVWPRVGAPFLIFVDDPDPAVAAFLEFWLVSSTVLSIEAAARWQLDDLRASEGDGT